MEKKKRFYYTFWWKELLFILIPVSVILSVSVVISSSLSKSTISHHESVIHYAISALETRFDNMGYTAYQISNSEDIQALMALQKEQTPQYYYQIRTLKERFVKMMNRVNFDNIIFYFDQSDVLITPSNFCTDVEKFYKTVFQYENMSFPQFQQFLENHEPNMPGAVDNIMVGADHYQGIFFLYRYTIPNAPDSGAYLFLLIDKDYMDTLFTSLTEKLSYISITDARGNLLYDNGVPFEALPEDQLLEQYLFTEITSRSQLTFRCYSPKAMVLKEVQMLHLALIGLSAAVLITILAFFTRKWMINSSFLSNIVAVSGIQDWGKHKNVFESIYQAMDTIVKDRQMLSLSMDNTMKTFRKDFFIRLITEDFIYQEEIALNAHYANINFEESAYYFILVSARFGKDIISAEDIHQLKSLNRSVAKQLEEEVGAQGHVLWNGSEELVVILNASLFVSQEECWRRIDELLCHYRQVTVEYDLYFEACMSEKPCNVLSLNLMYYICQRKIYQMFSQDNAPDSVDHAMYVVPLPLQPAVAQFTDAPLDKERFSTLNLILDEPRNRLIECCANGNAEESLHLLQEIFRQTIVENEIDGKIKDTLMTICKSIFVKACKDKAYPFSHIFETMNALHLSPALFQFLCASLTEICKINHSFSQGGSNHAMYLKISAYLDENLSDSEISLKTVSAALGFAPTYFSALFKEVMGDNFFQYIYGRRMLLAKELLTEGNPKIEDVGIQCGYANVASFRRAFKKFYGVNPSQIT